MSKKIAVFRERQYLKKINDTNNTEQPYNVTEIGLSQAELHSRHKTIRAEHRRTNCQKCKHKKHEGYVCYVMMGETGSPHQVCCLCGQK